ncbi:unnamed protein product [Merluccius merluccius]
MTTTTTTHPSLPEECSERNSYLLCLHNPQQIISLLTSRDKTTREDDPRSRLRKKKKTAQRRKPPPPRLAAVLPFVMPPLAAGRRCPILWEYTEELLLQDSACLPQLRTLL